MPKKLLLLFMLPFAGFAQQPLSSTPHLRPDPLFLRQHIYDGIPAELKQTNRIDRRCFRFADLGARYITNMVNSYRIEAEWREMDVYLNRVLQNVLPPELKEDSLIYAYAISHGHYNASMSPSGMMFINLGLFAEMQDEASLAAIMAHELAHYYKRHSLMTFLNSEAGKFKGGLIASNEANEFSIRNETQADSLAMIWLHNSGYSLSGMEKVFEYMVLRDRNHSMSSEDKQEDAEFSHPMSSNRLENLNRYKKLYETEAEGKEFKVSSILFKMLKKEARLKTLQVLLADYQYDKCIEKAFRFHLLDHGNADYVYYILEGIRRKCYMDATMWRENFITSRYFTSREVDTWEVKDKMKDHLFVNLNPDILMLGQQELQEIKARFYWEGEPKFTTYEQAFIFYYRVGLALGNNEVILSNALSIVENDTIRNELLKEYLSKPDIKYPEFAENLLTGAIWAGLRSRKLTIVDEFEMVVKQGEEIIKLSPTTTEEAHLRNILDTTLEAYPVRTIIYLKDLRESDFTEYRNFLIMKNFARTNTVAKGLQTELHILEPAFWKTFMRYGVNEVEFMECAIMETRKSGSTREEYINALNYSYSELLSSEKRSHNLLIALTTLREIENSTMKHRYGREYSLKFKDPAAIQIPNLLREHLDENERVGERVNNYYREHN